LTFKIIKIIFYINNICQLYKFMLKSNKLKI